MKRILLAAAGVVLVAVTALGAMAAIQYNPFGLVFPVAPLVLVIYFYSKALARNHINALLLDSCTLLILGLLIMLIFWPDPVLDALLVQRRPTFLLSLVFVLAGLVGTAIAVFGRRAPHPAVQPVASSAESDKPAKRE